MPDKLPKVTVVVLNWNRSDETLACLRYLEKIDVKGFTYSIMVVDNGSIDNSVSTFKKIKNQKLKIIAIEIILVLLKGTTLE